MHPVARLARVSRQVRSLAALHEGELDEIVGQLESAGQVDLAERLRTYRVLHAQETGLILDELDDIRADLAP